VADVNPLFHRYYIADIERSLRPARPVPRPTSPRRRTTDIILRILADLRAGRPARKTA
jgi:hypothetical protein